MQFLNTIFHSRQGRIAIIEKVNNHLVTKFYESPDDVIVGHLNDTYVGCCSYRDGIDRGRGKKADVVGLHAFWVDIDFNDGTHKKDGLPTRGEAETIIDNHFPCPTIKVMSGYGIHLWYVLRESISLNRDEDKQLWEHRMKMFQDRFRKYFIVDSTHNLDRILRVPGTMNHKHGKSVPVSSSYNEDSLYDWNDLKPDDDEQKQVVTAISVKSNGKAPVDKINALCDENDAFCDVFNRKVVVGDGTPSAYDFSIAIHCLKAGFDPGEVKETIIASTIANDGKMSKKHYRQDYFDKTLTKASMVVESELILGFKVIKFIKYLSEPPSYELQTDKGVVRFNSFAEILQPGKFSLRVAEYLDFRPSLPKPKDWLPIVDELLVRQEKVDLGQDGTVQDVVEAGIDKFKYDEGVCEEGIGKAFNHDGKFCIQLGEFRNWLDLRMRTSMHINKLAKHMRIAGYCPDRLIIEGERVRVWSKSL